MRIEKKLFDNDYKKFNFEIKKSNPNLKKKFSFLKKKRYKKNNTLIEKKFFESKILSKKILPILSTEYLRNYYYSDKYGRITIDQDIQYQRVTWKNFHKSFNFNKKIKDKRIVIEHKIENNLLENDFITLVPSRFSKYCEGVKMLNIF